MASNLAFSWTARATLFLSNGSETQRIAALPHIPVICEVPTVVACSTQSNWYLLRKCICFSTVENSSSAALWPLGQRSHIYPICKIPKMNWLKKSNVIWKVSVVMWDIDTISKVTLAEIKDPQSQ